MNVCAVSAEALDINSRANIREVIDYETSYLTTLSSNDYKEISRAYVSRGESYLICEQYENALQDFLTGLDAMVCLNDREKEALYLRVLFGLFVVYGNLNLVDHFYSAMETISNFIGLCKCENFYQIHLSFNKTFPMALKANFGSTLLKNQNDGCNAGESSIAGPDIISIQDCIERVDGTAFAIKALFSRAKSEIRFVAFEFIHALSVQAKDCCYSGGLWKGCLRPIINKWQQWKICGIPADPAWD